MAVKRVYVLKNLTKEEYGIWSSIKKIYDKFSEDKEENFQAYSTFAHRLQKDNKYKFHYKNEVYLIEVKELQ